MRRYGIRILGLALVMALAGGLTLLLSDRPAAAPEAAGELETAGERDTGGTAGILMIRSETGREPVSLYSSSWKQLDRLRLSEAGEGSLERPPAGDYHLIRGDGSTLSFTLDDAGMVCVSSGKGWGNGAILELTEERRGSILVRYHTDKTAACRLEGGGAVYSGTLAAEDQNGDGAEYCFNGLLPGEYQLFVDEEWVISVAIKELSMDRIVGLY